MAVVTIVGAGMLGSALEDSEGLQTMRILAENMSFLMKSIAVGKDRFGLPEKEQRCATNFIRQD